ncbi:MAG TPA: histidine phosphatase family protein [Thermoleophilia bacterium]
MTLLLVRHGETDWNREPARCQGWAEIGLNESGRDQARDVGRTLAARDVELIVTSHLLRARETAELIREELGGELPLIVDPRLAETHRGEWESRLFLDIMAEEPETWRHYREHPETFRFPGGEGLADHQRRVLAALRDAARGARPALLVTHGGSIRVARCFLEGRDLAAFHDTKTINGGVDEVPANGLADRIGAFLAGRA